MQEVVEWPQQNPEALARLGGKPPAGVLLYGQPGCSKTLLARAVAAEVRGCFLSQRSYPSRLRMQRASAEHDLGNSTPTLRAGMVRSGEVLRGAAARTGTLLPRELSSADPLRLMPQHVPVMDGC